MCVQTYRRSKSSRPSTLPPKKQKPSKQLKIKHAAASNDGNDHAQVQSRRRKSVSFNEVVMVQPLHHAETKKSVSFREVVMVRPVLHLADYTDQEIADCFINHSDKQRTKIEILNTLRMVKEGNAEVCNRGLEKLSDGGRTRERRRNSIREVLEEVEAQKAAFHKSKNNKDEKIVFNVSKLRKAYKPHSRAARHVAHAVGKIDEMASVCQRVAIPHASTRRC